MKPYIDWMDSDGFYIQDAWDAVAEDTGGPGRLILFPRQRRILGYALQMDENGKLKYETILYSDIKKTGKTVIAASIGAWYLEESRPGTEIYISANSREQGTGRVMKDMKYHFERRRLERGEKYCNVTQYRIELSNGSFVQVISQSYSSSAGSRHAMTLFDELWGSTGEFDRRVWDEMTPIPTIRNSLRVITSYAGFENESDLLWELYLRGVGPDEHHQGTGTPIKELDGLPCYENGNMFTYWSHESDLPWYTDEYLQKQMDSERPSSYIRLFQNRWVTSHEEFIPIVWWDRATKAYPGPVTLWNEHPFKNWPLVFAVDAGLMRDSTALIGVGYDSARGKVGLAYHAIWAPSKDNQVDLDATVERTLLDLSTKCHIVSIRYDPTHLVQTMLRLKDKGLPTEVFHQTEANMTQASQLLYDLLRTGNLEAYPDDTLRRHIQMAVASSSSRGFRITKRERRGGLKNHNDGAIAMAMAAYDAVHFHRSDTSEQIFLQSPFSDMQAEVDPAESWLPPQLRNG